VNVDLKTVALRRLTRAKHLTTKTDGPMSEGLFDAVGSVVDSI